MALAQATRAPPWEMQLAGTPRPCLPQLIRENPVGDEVSADKPSESCVVDLGKRSSVGPVSLAFEAESTTQGFIRAEEAFCAL